MKRSLLMVGIPVAVVGLGLATWAGIRQVNKPSADPFADELRAADAAGLELAQSQTSQKFALSETVPEAKPQPRTTVRKSTSGPKAVRSSTPVVKAAPEPVIADVVEEIPDLSRPQPSNSPQPVQVVVPVNPEPAPEMTPAPAADQGPVLRGGSGGGAGSGTSGGGWGTIFGAVIRGGVVDGDNCDPRGAHRRAGTGTIISRMPVYNPNPTGMGSVRTGGVTSRRIGGMGGTGIVASRPRGRP